MSLNPRQAAIVQLVEQKGSRSIDQLAKDFQVTLQTVRRDVQMLSELGLLARFHGGVRLPSSTTENVAYRQRQQMNQLAKEQIAKQVASCVPNDCSLMMNIGTTTEAIAHQLLGHKGLRVITNNLNVANILADNPDCEVIVTAGVVRHRDKGITGEATVDFIKQFKVDIGLIGISGIEKDGTLRDFDYREVKVSKAIVEHSRAVWLSADHSKFDRPAMVEMAHLADIDKLFTDQKPLPHFAKLLLDNEVQCVVSKELAMHNNDD